MVNPPQAPRHAAIGGEKNRLKARLDCGTNRDGRRVTMLDPNPIDERADALLEILRRCGDAD